MYILIVRLSKQFQSTIVSSLIWLSMTKLMFNHSRIRAYEKKDDPLTYELKIRFLFCRMCLERLLTANWNIHPLQKIMSFWCCEVQTCLLFTEQEAKPISVKSQYQIYMGIIIYLSLKKKTISLIVIASYLSVTWEFRTLRERLSWVMWYIIILPP